MLSAECFLGILEAENREIWRTALDLCAAFDDGSGLSTAERILHAKALFDIVRMLVRAHHQDAVSRVLIPVLADRSREGDALIRRFAGAASRTTVLLTQMDEALSATGATDRGQQLPNLQARALAQGLLLQLALERRRLFPFARRALSEAEWSAAVSDLSRSRRWSAGAVGLKARARNPMSAEHPYPYDP